MGWTGGGRTDNLLVRSRIHPAPTTDHQVTETGYILKVNNESTSHRTSGKIRRTSLTVRHKFTTTQTRPTVETATQCLDDASDMRSNEPLALTILVLALIGEDRPGVPFHSERAALTR